MGDRRRFELFAAEIARRFPAFREARVADVAGGKGGLRAALACQGFRDVTTIDKRRRLAKGRPGERYGLFDWRKAPAYDLLAAMHPDEATDHCVLYAAARRVPFVVCPCCVKPSAAEYRGPRDKRQWAHHLEMLAAAGRMRVHRLELRMAGDALVLVGVPLERRIGGL